MDEPSSCVRIRQALPGDLDSVAAIEAECFPPAEAATRESFEKRLAAFPTHFWLAEANGKVIGMINGMVTDSPVIVDEMYEDAGMHSEDAAWQSVFGLDVLPAWRRKGVAARLMEHLIARARAEGRRGCILTCKERLIHYYAKFGYRDMGISGSTHGGVVWHDMVLEF